MPVTPTLSSASFTSSSLKGLMMASIFFMRVPSVLDEATAMPSRAGRDPAVFPLRIGGAWRPFRQPMPTNAASAGTRGRSARAHADRQVPKARVLVAPGPFRPAVELYRRETRDQLLVEDAELEPREVRPQA